MAISDIINKLGIEPNAMQQAACSAITSTRNDVVVLSPTGSGKTLAYLLPLSELIDAQSDDVQAVVIVPGRELAMQSATVLRSMGSGLRACACYGGRAAMDEHRTLRKVLPQIVFATPGRLNDHLDKGNIDGRTVRYVVIDEFDKCLEMGFQDEMSRIMDKLPLSARHILLSATDAEEIPAFVDIKGAERLNFLGEEQAREARISMMSVRSQTKDKLDTLGRLLRALGEGSSIVFVNYRESVERVDAYLRDNGFSTSAFHGGLDQRGREDALYKFANGSACVLVATDLASRGLDIPDISNIIHYHLPESEDGYIHRVGRTARWDKHGRAFFILGPEEDIPEYVADDVAIYTIPDGELPAPAKPRMATLYIGKGKKDKISKGDIVGFLCKKGGLKAQEIGRIDVADRYSYVAVERQKAAVVLRRVAGEKIKGVKTVVEPVRG